jgi:hypothetical protein
LAIADIKKIDWKQAALDNLHIPAKKKKAMQALSETYVKRASTNSFDDIIERKGQGFNILLQYNIYLYFVVILLTRYISGPLGVRKTLTAELLAEYLQRPLMPVSASELGTTAETVEKRLPCIFKRAA